MLKCGIMQGYYFIYNNKWFRIFYYNKHTFLLHNLFKKYLTLGSKSVINYKVIYFNII